jgi:hypothetical protein
MAHAIILSKDRAAQAHLCLESIKRNDNGLFDSVSVLFHTSNQDYKRGYLALEKAFPGVSLIEQDNYYDNVMELLDGFHFTSFFTDDDILYRKIPVNQKDVSFLFDEPEIGCLSLRLGMNTYIQDPYVGSKVVKPSSEFWFNFTEFITWTWKDCPIYTNFGYPLSVDGHIFHTNELRTILEQCKFNNPNQQEIAMMSKIDIFPHKMSCFEHSVLINTPINRVQDTCMNRAGEKCRQEPAEMNQRYLNGEKLDFNSIDFSNIIGCHQELDIKWTTK